jgi:hypothetical protein
VTAASERLAAARFAGAKECADALANPAFVVVQNRFNELKALTRKDRR